MNWLDLLLGVILAFSLLQGIIRGFSRVAILFAGTIAGLVMAIWFYPVVARFLAPYTNGLTLANFLGFVIIFVTIQIAANLISWSISKVFKASGLSWLDRLLGGAFGLLRAMVISTVLVLGLMAFPFQPMASAVATSTIAPYVLGVAEMVSSLAPEELKRGFAETYERVKQLWNATSPPKKAEV